MFSNNFDDLEDIINMLRKNDIRLYLQPDLNYIKNIDTPF